MRYGDKAIFKMAAVRRPPFGISENYRFGHVTYISACDPTSRSKLQAVIIPFLNHNINVKNVYFSPLFFIITLA